MARTATRLQRNCGQHNETLSNTSGPHVHRDFNANCWCEFYIDLGFCQKCSCGPCGSSSNTHLSGCVSSSGRNATARHPERSEGSQPPPEARFFATLRMTVHPLREMHPFEPRFCHKVEPYVIIQMRLALLSYRIIEGYQVDVISNRVCRVC